MTEKEIINTINKYESRSMHGQLSVVWDSALDDKVWDINGKGYIDFTSGICVTNVGHTNDEIIRALCQQSMKLSHSYTFNTEIKAKFLKFLINNTPSFCEKAFLVSSGTEATEAAVKMMRMYGMKIRRRKRFIISFEGAMHGRTMLAEQLKGRNKDNKWAFEKEAPEICWLNFPNKEDNFNPEELFYSPQDIAGIIIETYQGWSARFYPKKYIQNLVKWCKKNNILVCFDEIQGGMERTGKLFNYMHYKVEPDLICVGKGFTSSLPMAGVIGRKEILDTPEEGSMSSTHSANPLCCAVGLVNFKEILRILPSVKSKGDLLHKRLKEIFPDCEINGKGLLAGIVTGSEEYATKVCYKAMKKGLLLIKTGRESIKIAPPLIISKKNLEKGLQILEEVK